jgi:hypothetical protein
MFKMPLLSAGAASKAQKRPQTVPHRTPTPAPHLQMQRLPRKETKAITPYFLDHLCQPDPVHNLPKIRRSPAIWHLFGAY